MRTDLCTTAGVSLALALLAAPAAQGVTVYVDDDADLGGDGATWATAYRYLQDALITAGDGTEIHVAQGIYTPDQDEAGNVTPGDRNATFHLVIGVTLMGGYAGIGMPDPDERDIALYETTLSGDLLGDDLPGFVNNADNSKHVVTGSGTDDTAIIDGFTITAGNASGPVWPALDSSGAGILNDAGSPTVTNCLVADNRALQYGGGMENLYGSSPAVSNTVFRGNASGDTGAGMDNSFGAAPTVIGCTFERNAVEETFPGTGGGIYSYQSNPTIQDCVFTRNTARDGGGVTYEQSSGTISGCEFTENVVSYVGAALVNAYSASPTITDCSFTANVALVDAGGNGGLGGAVLNWDNCHPDISNCTFTENYARNNGGAIYNRDGSHPTITACSFVDNESQDAGGGAVRNYNGSSPTVTGCTFTGNQGASGGGMHNNIDCHPLVIDCVFTGNAATTYNGGAMVNNNGSHPTIIGCTFTTNSTSLTGGWGGGMHNRQGSSPVVVGCLFDGNSSIYNGGGMSNFMNTSALIVNCSFIDNSAGHVGGGLHLREYAEALVVNCLFVGNSAGDHSGGGVRAGKWTSPSFVNCTFSGNDAPFGGAIAAGSDTEGVVGHTRMANCVVWNNTAPLGPEIALMGIYPAELTIAYSDVRGGELDVYVQPGFILNWGAGNIDDDPMFVDAAGGNYTLAAGSPCVDAGHNWHVPSDGADLDTDGNTAELTPMDLGGNPRFADNPAVSDTGCGVPVVVDMGAYEYQGSPFPVKLGDIDGDGLVGINDFLVLLGTWGPCADDCCPADLDLDAEVGITDFLILLAKWD
ncbi:MAG: right-handed parallel beta-helix repeat-containing protein [Planctomycetota bacterium]